MNALDRLRTYHVAQRASLTRGGEPQIAYQQRPNVAGFSKTLRIERLVELVLPPRSREQAAQPRTSQASELEDMLEKDTRHNETMRRPKVHAKLAELGMKPPEEITGWLYRDVLNADIEDPYLGLGDLLFSNYPFAKEERLVKQ